MRNTEEGEIKRSEKLMTELITAVNNATENEVTFDRIIGILELIKFQLIKNFMMSRIEKRKEEGAEVV